MDSERTAQVSTACEREPGESEVNAHTLLPPPGDPPPPGRRLCRPGSIPAPPSTDPRGTTAPSSPTPPPRAAAVPLERAEGGGVSRGPSAPSPGSGTFLWVGVFPGGGPSRRGAGAARSSGRVLRASLPGSLARLSRFLSRSLSPRGTWASAPAPARRHSLQCGLGAGARGRRSADPPRRPGDRRAIGALGSRGRAAATAAGTPGPRVTSAAPPPPTTTPAP